MKVSSPLQSVWLKSSYHNCQSRPAWMIEYIRSVISVHIKSCSYISSGCPAGIWLWEMYWRFAWDDSKVYCIASDFYSQSTNPHCWSYEYTDISWPVLLPLSKERGSILGAVRTSAVFGSCSLYAFQSFVNFGVGPLLLGVHRHRKTDCSNFTNPFRIHMPFLCSSASLRTATSSNLYSAALM